MTNLFLIESRIKMILLEFPKEMHIYSATIHTPANFPRQLLFSTSKINFIKSDLLKII